MKNLNQHHSEIRNQNNTKDLNQHHPETPTKRKTLCSILCMLLSCTAVLALHCRFEIFGGGFPDSNLLNGLNKLYNTFSGPDFADLLLLIAIYALLRFISVKDSKIDRGFLLFSFTLSALLVICISFKKFDSAVFLFANSFQLLISLLCITGFWVIIYAILRGIYHLLQDGIKLNSIPSHRESFLEKHFSLIGFGVILIGWLPWILLNYPGSGCPDGLLQLQQFLGQAPWSAGHPPLSTCIMGSLFTLGQRLIDANFGFFLYCLFQTCTGAWIFSLSMKKLQNLGIPAKWCMWGILFFAFTPLWGTYAQWVEKDLFFAQICVLQTISMLDILVKKQCGTKDALLLAGTSLGAVFLRNNGIHAILPALLLLTIWLRGRSRKRVLAVMLTTLLVYESVMKILFPSLGVLAVHKSETLSIPFQQTARYVIEHLEDVTEHEREVIDSVFGFESMFNYNPVISDPVKGSYRGADLTEYYKIWFLMFFKHPDSYLSAFVNLSYGYLAPVSQNIEAWIQEEYYESMEDMGLYHVFDIHLAYFLAQIWHLSMNLPLVKYLCTPGMYTWIIMALAMLLIKRRCYSSLILLVPSIMNILVCLASPLADAIRYELPTVASTPLLIGWVYYSFRSQFFSKLEKNS